MLFVSYTSVRISSFFRPHFHEMMVHYPASYIDDVKRVLYIGGGDNKLIHEILKYPHLELVVGMELDKKVNEGSFKHFETQPHFDNSKVEWWFGDARKSLYLLPEEYRGTFDLIYLDLQPEISDSEGFIDRLFSFTRQDTKSIICRNEDGRFGTNEPFAKYLVDLYLDDMPFFCRQGMTMGSNNIDFIKSPRLQHNISTLYFDSSDPIHHNKWFNYRNLEGQGNDQLEEEGSKRNFNSAPSLDDAGVFMVLELEEITKSMNESMDKDIFSALTEAGFTLQEPNIIRSSPSPNKDNPLDTLVFFMEEGYVVARILPKEKYCGLDIVLWRSYDKLNAAKRLLETTFDSVVTSSYRLVTSGLFVDTNDDRDDRGGPHETNMVPDSKSTLEISNPNEDVSKRTDPVNPNDTSALIETSIATFLSHVQGSPEILILCGEMSQPCNALDVVKKSVSSAAKEGTTVIYACPKSKSKFTCEARIRRLMKQLIESERKVDFIFIDSEAPKDLGQILNKILRGPELRGHLLSERFMALGTSQASTTKDCSSRSSWLRAFMERFRTDFIPYNPSFHAEVVFEEHGLGSLELSLYSSGNPNFYTDLVQFVASTEEQMRLSADIRYVKNGLNHFVADFTHHKSYTHGDYDSRPARLQMESQNPLGRQSVATFNVNYSDLSEFPEMLLRGFQLTLSLMNNEDLIPTDKSTIGLSQFVTSEGEIAFVALWEDCSAVIVDHGNSQLTANLFTPDQSELVHKKFLEFLRMYTVNNDCIENKDGVCRLTLEIEIIETHPRGTGRVVVFP